jgi:hypothetical protein
MVAAAKQGSAINVGIDHPNYTHEVSPVAENYRLALQKDLS